MSITETKLDIRRVHDLPTYEKMVALQRETWGFADVEIAPTHVLHIAEASGGQVLGAFTPAGELVAFALSFLAWDSKNSKRFLMSHLVAVKPSLQAQSLGFEIKQAQKRDALEHGITNVRWTFDPLLTKNGNLNLRKLGARVYRFLPNEYGIIKSELYGEVRSDRFEVSWDLESDASIPFPEHSECVLDAIEGQPSINQTLLRSGEQNLSMTVPLDIVALRQKNPARAREWQDAVAAVSQALLDGRYRVATFRVNGERGQYLFERLRK
ncbi:MAG: hypothetical protein J0M12_07345 [Deltaproteobacteria bacterium]|nr:hypothetical protein [Deltaproteobacteria bacterium]